MFFFLVFNSYLTFLRFFLDLCTYMHLIFFWLLKIDQKLNTKFLINYSYCDIKITIIYNLIIIILSKHLTFKFPRKSYESPILCIIFFKLCVINMFSSIKRLTNLPLARSTKLLHLYRFSISIVS